MRDVPGTARMTTALDSRVRRGDDPAPGSDIAGPLSPAAGTRIDLPPIPGRTLHLLGYDFATGRARGIVAAAAAQPSQRPRLIVTANIDHIVLLSDNPAFARAYDGAAFRTLDGMPLVWLARLLGKGRAPRVTGHDLLDSVLTDPPAFANRVFLVCAEARVAVAIRARLGHSLPAGAVAAVVPPFGFESDPAYGRALAERVRAHETTLLIMGVGAPKSEIWVDQAGAALGNPVVLSVGEALNVAAGLVPRAPRILQWCSLEWLYRFALSPRRLFRRYFVRSWRFVAIVARAHSPFAGSRPRGRRHVGAQADEPVLHETLR